MYGHELANKKNIHSDIPRKFKIRSYNRIKTDDNKLLRNRLREKTKV